MNFNFDKCLQYLIKLIAIKSPIENDTAYYMHIFFRFIFLDICTYNFYSVRTALFFSVFYQPSDDARTLAPQAEAVADTTALDPDPNSTLIKPFDNDVKFELSPLIIDLDGCA